MLYELDIILVLLLGLVLGSGLTLFLRYVFVSRQASSAHQNQSSLQSKNTSTLFPDLNPNPVMRLNEHGKVTYANAASQELLAFWSCHAGQTLPKEWVAVIENVIQRNQAEKMELDINEHRYYLNFTPNKQNNFVYLYGFELTDYYAILNQAKLQMAYDAVTGLPNQLLLIDYLKMHIERLKSHCHVFVYTIFLTDPAELALTLDSQTMNQAMVKLKDEIAASLPEEASFGRLSDRTFLIINSDFYNHGQAISVAQLILDRISKPLVVGEHSVLFDCCVGISVYPDDTQNPELLLRNSKLAQSRAAAENKPFLFYQSGLDEQVQIKRKILVDLHAALEKSQLMMFYQPQMSLSKRAFTGAEALIRWKHPEQGFVSPFFFVSAAEESGLIIPVGRWILETVCRDISNLQQKGIFIKIAINLSAVQFMQDDLLATISDLVQKHNVSPEYLEFEITEGVVMQDIKKTIEKMHALRKSGFSLSIDDFGTGYSSLNYLQQFPIQKLKIDRVFIKDMHMARQSFNMTKGIINLGHSLNLDLVAEGVEKKEQVDMLCQLKCDFIQGYYYSQPVPFEQLVCMLQNS